MVPDIRFVRCRDRIPLDHSVKEVLRIENDRSLGRFRQRGSMPAVREGARLQTADKCRGFAAGIGEYFFLQYLADMGLAKRKQVRYRV